MSPGAWLLAVLLIAAGYAAWRATQEGGFWGSCPSCGHHRSFRPLGRGYRERLYCTVCTLTAAEADDWSLR